MGNEPGGDVGGGDARGLPRRREDVEVEGCRWRTDHQHGLDGRTLGMMILFTGVPRKKQITPQK